MSEEISPAVSAVLEAGRRFSKVTAAYADACGMSPEEFMAHIARHCQALTSGETPPAPPPADPAKLEAAAKAVQAVLDQMEPRRTDATDYVIGLA